MFHRPLRYLRRAGLASAMRRAGWSLWSLVHYRCDLVLLAKTGDIARAPVSVPEGVALKQVGPDQTELLLRDLYIRPSQIRQMLDRGDVCVAAIAWGHIAASAWGAFALADIPEIFHRATLPPRCCYINTVECDQAFRRQGLAKAAVLEVEQVASEIGVETLCVAVHEQNTPSMRLFEGLGYRRFRIAHARRILGVKRVEPEVLNPEFDFLLNSGRGKV